MLRRSQYCSSWQTGGDAESGSWSDSQSWASSVPGMWDSRHRSVRFSCCASSGSGCRPCWWGQSAPFGWSRAEPDHKEGGPPEERRVHNYNRTLHQSKNVLWEDVGDRFQLTWNLMLLCHYLFNSFSTVWLHAKRSIILQTTDLLPAVCTELPAAPPAGLHGLCGTKRALWSSPVNLLSSKIQAWSAVLGLAADAGWADHPGWLVIGGKKTSQVVDTHDTEGSPAPWVMSSLVDWCTPRPSMSGWRSLVCWGRGEGPDGPWSPDWLEWLPVSPWKVLRHWYWHKNCFEIQIQIF